jgi:tetratricopeptide (TPR) repeat protein
MSSPPNNSVDSEQFQSNPDLDKTVETVLKLIEESDLIEAEYELNQDITLGKDYPPLVALMGEVKRLKKEYSQAREYLERAYALDNEYPPVVKSLGYLYLEQGNFDMALAKFNQYLALETDDPNAYDIKIAIYSAKNQQKGTPLADYHGTLLFEDHVKVLENCERAVGKPLLNLPNQWYNDIGYCEKYHCVFSLSFYESNLPELPMGVDSIPTLSYLNVMGMNFLTKLPTNLLYLKNFQELEASKTSPLSPESLELIDQFKQKNVNVLMIPPMRPRWRLSKKAAIFAIIILAFVFDIFVLGWLFS